VDTEAFLKAGWWASDYSEIRDDRALSFQSRWWWYDDTKRFVFLVRAEVPGEYSILGRRACGGCMRRSASPARRFGLWCRSEAFMAQ
jgi:hypothetical protein